MSMMGRCLERLRCWKRHFGELSQILPRLRAFKQRVLAQLQTLQGVETILLAEIQTLRQQQLTLAAHVQQQQSTLTYLSQELHGLREAQPTVLQAVVHLVEAQQQQVQGQAELHSQLLKRLADLGQQLSPVQAIPATHQSWKQNPLPLEDAA